jgi:hypothetical protein
VQVTVFTKAHIQDLVRSFSPIFHLGVSFLAMVEVQEQQQTSSQVFDDFNLDLVIKVLSLSLWSPAFAMWVPIVTMAQVGSSRTSFSFFPFALG